MEKINIRRLEVIAGKYHHIDVIKFINYILMEYSTPLNQSFVKPIISNNYLSSPMDINNNTNLKIYHFDDGKKNKLSFKTSVAYNQNNICENEKVIFISKNPINNYETTLPLGYSWIDDEIIYNKFIINYNNFINHGLNNDINNQNIFKEFHLFLNGFENLLEKCIIPQYIELSKTNTKMELINKYLTIPVVIAFDKVFLNTNLSFISIILKNGISKNYLDWIQNLNQKFNIEFLSKYCYDMNLNNFVIHSFISNKYLELIKNFT